MSQAKRYYEINWTYTDTGETFSSGASLTPPQRRTVENELKRLDELGYISNASIYRPEPVRQGFKALMTEIAEAIQHPKVKHGLCRICGHHGDDCTGVAA